MPVCLCAVTRNRMGRLLTFVSRIMVDSNQTVITGVGVDEHTALLLDSHTGVVTAVGVGTAYMCTPAHSPEVCKSKTPLTFTGRCVYISPIHYYCVYT